MHSSKPVGKEGMRSPIFFPFEYYRIVRFTSHAAHYPRAAVSFYFRRYGERNHAGLAISPWKAAAQVLALDGRRMAKKTNGKAGGEKERARGGGRQKEEGTEIFRSIDRGFEFITDAGSEITATRVIKNILPES